VVGDTSTLEKEAAEAARDMELTLTIVEKADKGEFDVGATCRDEKVVALFHSGCELRQVGSLKVV